MAMKLPLRSAPVALPGLTARARSDRRTSTLIPRLQAGEIAVIDHLDLDRATAERLVSAGVVAVLNRSQFVSGRFPNQGPATLLDAGVVLVDGIGESWGELKDGATLRLDDGVIWIDDTEVARGRVLDRALLDDELAAARGQMSTQLHSFTHNTTEFIRREEELLLHGRGAPRIGTAVEGRPVVVAAPGPELREELTQLRAWWRETKPAVIAIEGAADEILQAGHQVDVLVLAGHGASAGDSLDRVSAGAVRAATDVVVVVERGHGSQPLESIERLGAAPLRFETQATAEDAGLMLAQVGRAQLIVGAGLHATIEDFLDRRHGGVASTFLTRLTVGERLVDARAVPALYGGRVSPWQLWLALLIGVLAVVAAIATTPVGQDWLDAAQPHLTDAWTSFRDWAGGLW